MHNQYYQQRYHQVLENQIVQLFFLALDSWLLTHNA